MADVLHGLRSHVRFRARRGDGAHDDGLDRVLRQARCEAFVQGRVSSLQCAQRPEVIKGFPLGAYPAEFGIYAPFYSFNFGGSPPALMRMPLEGAFIVFSVDKLQSTVWAHPRLTTMQIIFMAMAQYGTIFALLLNFKRVTFIIGHLRRLRGVATAPAMQMQREDVQATMANPMRASRPARQ